MGSINKLIKRLVRSPEPEVVVVNSQVKSKPLAAPVRKKTRADGLPADIFKQMLQAGTDIVFFDPEEDKCFVYFLFPDEAVETRSIGVGEWKEFSTPLKEMNNHIVLLDDDEFICALSISLTNLGERIAARLLEHGMDQDMVKDAKREASRRVNRLKPATSMTHRNLERLFKLIESRKGMTQGDLVDLFLQEKLLEQDDIEEIRKDADYKTLFSGPYARKQLTLIASRWLGVEYYDVEMDGYDEDTAKLVPRETAEKIMALAYQSDENSVKVAMGNPFDSESINKLREILGKEIKPYICAEEDIRYELEKIHERY